MYTEKSCANVSACAALLRGIAAWQAGAKPSQATHCASPHPSADIEAPAYARHILPGSSVKVTSRLEQGLQAALVRLLRTLDRLQYGTNRVP